MRPKINTGINNFFKKGKVLSKKVDKRDTHTHTKRYTTPGNNEILQSLFENE